MSPNRLLAIVVKELRQLGRDRLTFAMILGIPALQLLLFGFAINMDIRNINAAFADEARTAHSREIIAGLESTGLLSAQAPVRTPRELQELIRQGRINIGIVIPADLERRLDKTARRRFDCCVDLGSESVDTRSNSEEAKRWLDRRKYKSLRLVTSDWHERRAMYEFNRQLGGGYTVIPDAVRTEPRFMTLFAEYNKYLLRRMSVWLDI